MATVKNINGGTGEYTLNAGNLSVVLNNGTLDFFGNNVSNTWAPNSAGNIGSLGNGINAIYAASYFFSNGIPIAGNISVYANSNVFAYLGSNSNVVITTTGNITTTANISGNYIFGNGAFLTGITSGGTNYSNANVAAYLPTYSGNLPSLTGNVSTTGNLSANANITGLNLFVTNVEAASNVNAITVSATNLGATDIYASNVVLALNGIGTGDIFIPNGLGNRISINGLFMGNAANPELSQDLATKAYVDAASGGLQVKNPVLVLARSFGSITYANGSNIASPGVGATITNNGTQVPLTIDGVTGFSAGDRVLVAVPFAGPGTTYYNGIYTVTNPGSGASNWVLTRSTDCDTPVEFYNAYALVQQGTLYKGSGWVCNNNGVTNPISEINTSANITFTQFSATESYGAGPGITLTGTTFSANVDNQTINFASGNLIQINPNSNITSNNVIIDGNLRLYGDMDMSYGNVGTFINNPNGNIEIAEINCSNTISVGNLIEVGSTATGNVAFLGNVYISNSPGADGIISGVFTPDNANTHDAANMGTLGLYSGYDLENLTTLPPPTSSPISGYPGAVPGAIRFDNTYVYVCISETAGSSVWHRILGNTTW